MAENSDYAAAVAESSLTSRPSNWHEEPGEHVDILGPYQANAPLRCALGRIERSAARALYRRLHRVVALGAATENRPMRAFSMDSSDQPDVAKRSYRRSSIRPRVHPGCGLRQRRLRNLLALRAEIEAGRPSARRKYFRSFLLTGARSARWPVDQLPFTARQAASTCWGSDPCGPRRRTPAS